MSGLLLTLHHGPHKRRWLREVVGYDVPDEATVLRAVQDGIVSVHRAGDHGEVAKVGAYEFRRAREHYVALTSKGRALLP